MTKNRYPTLTSKTGGCVRHSKTDLQCREVQSVKITIISQQIKLCRTKEFFEVTLI